MYIAKKEINGRTHYFIRETYSEDGKLKSRTLFALGPNPSKYIVYPGGNSYYIHESVELSILEKGFNVDTFELEDLFWPFLDTRLKRIIKKPAEKRPSAYKGLSREKLREVQAGIHLFDKRRLHYLRFGVIDQRDILAIPYRFYNKVLGKSRDEIECIIDEMEERLKPAEIKIYIYTIFNLQRHFYDSPLCRTAPYLLDQDRMDDCFLEELCHLNQDHTFFGTERNGESLHEYLKKYLIMYFDNDFVKDPEAELHERLHRRGFYQPGETGISLSIEEACTRMKISVNEFRAMSKRRLTRHFKKLAHECHPDKGGDHEEFIRIRDAYKRLLEEKERG